MKINTGFLAILLIITAFFLGKFWTEANYLKNSQINSAASGNNQVVTPPGTPPTAAVKPIPALKTKVDLKIDKYDAVMGKDDAKVTLVEFADYQCPFCGAMAGGNKDMVAKLKSQDSKWEPLSPSLENEYIKSGKVRFVYKDFAFLDDGTDSGESHLAAQAAYCSGDQNKYFEFHGYLYSHQNGENKGAFTKEKLQGFAVELGLNTNTFNDCLTSGKFSQKVKDNTALAASVGVNGTPTLFINGQLLTDSQGQSGTFPYSFIKQAIESELKK